MEDYTIKIAKGLANNADARLIRQQVFVEEQGFVNEFDDIDHEAYHAVIYTGGYPIATGRLFDENGEAHIGRICVRKAYRGRDLGRMIVEALEKQAEKVGYKEVGYFRNVYIFGQEYTIAKALTKITGGVTFVNSVASTVCVVLLYLALRPALERANLLPKAEKKADK